MEISKSKTDRTQTGLQACWQAKISWGKSFKPQSEPGFSEFTLWAFQKAHKLSISLSNEPVGWLGKWAKKTEGLADITAMDKQNGTCSPCK